MYRLLLVTLVLLSSLLFADALQDDWSGNSGVLGPVISWGSDYYQSDSLECADELSLEHISFPDDYIYECVWIDSTSTGGEPSSPIMLDLNSDEVCDFAFYRNNGTNDNSFVVYKNNDGTGENWSSGVVYSWYQTYGITRNTQDMDSDGDLDLAVGFREPGSGGYMHYEVVWVENDGSTSNWQDHAVLSYTGPYDRYLLDVMDIDLDGDGDMLIYIGYSPNVTRIFNNTDGLGTTWSQYDLWSGSKEPDLFFDLDGDDDLDMIVDDTEIWINQGGSGSSWYAYDEPNFQGKNMKFAYDLDEDGDDDLIYEQNNSIYWYENIDSGNNWIAHTVASLCYGGVRDVVDFDLDGDLDILRSRADTLFYHENVDLGSDNWVEHVTLLPPDGGLTNWDYGELNGDSLGDFLFLHRVSGIYDLKFLQRTLHERYCYSGVIESSILDASLAKDIIWGWLLYESDEPDGTSVDVQVRASSDYTNMGIYSPSLASGADLSEYCMPDENYFQYMITFNTTDSLVTPSFSEFAIAFSTGIAEGAGSRSLEPTISIRNPASSNELIHFGVTPDTQITVSVYDLSGRSIASLFNGVSLDGEETVSIGDLPNGTYMIRLSSPETEILRKMVVIN